LADIGFWPGTGANDPWRRAFIGRVLLNRLGGRRRRAVYQRKCYCGENNEQQSPGEGAQQPLESAGNDNGTYSIPLAFQPTEGILVLGHGPAFVNYLLSSRSNPCSIIGLIAVFFTLIRQYYGFFEPLLLRIGSPLAGRSAPYVCAKEAASR
jgi:hypothetical protein